MTLSDNIPKHPLLLIPIMKRLLAYTLMISLSQGLLAQQKKNVLFLMADDFNHWAKAIGYYPESHTPHIDSLARMGVLFTDAHCSSPVCNPSRNALWSGFRPSTTGISRNSDGYVREKNGFADIITMNQYFTGNGYYTYATGKLYHPGRMNMDNEDCDPDNWSFVNEHGTGCNGGSLYSYECNGWDALKFSANSSPLSRSNCNDYDMAHVVADFISNYDTANHSGMPFFLGCGFFRPHLPWNSPVELWNLIDYEALTEPAGVKPGEAAGSAHQSVVDDGVWMRAIQAYLGSVALADSCVGVVLDALMDSPYRDNTIVLFMGDHGWHLGEKGHWGKFTTWDEANHTTLIIYDPSAAGNGRQCSRVVSLQDLYPTLVELCGLPEKTGIEGRSIAHLLNQPGDTTWNWPILMKYGDKDYMKTNRWRFVEDGNDSRLHNMETDPYQWENLYQDSQYGDVVARLRSQIDSIKQIGFDLRDSLLANTDPPTIMHELPCRIEAEDFLEMEGIQKEVTADTEGDQNIGFINSGDWCTYGVVVDTAGIYNMKFRAASASDGGTIQVDAGVTPAGSLTIPSTGGWQQWQDFETDVELFQGSYTFKLRFSGAGGYLMNLNYMDLSLKTGVGIQSRNGGRELLISNTTVDGHLLLDLTYTNPVARVEIYDLNGRVIQTEYVAGEQEVAIPMDSSMTTGMYLVRVDDREDVYTGTFLFIP